MMTNLKISPHICLILMRYARKSSVDAGRLFIIIIKIKFICEPKKDFESYVRSEAIGFWPSAFTQIQYPDF